MARWPTYIDMIHQRVNIWRWGIGERMKGWTNLSWSMLKTSVSRWFLMLSSATTARLSRRNTLITAADVTLSHACVLISGLNGVLKPQQRLFFVLDLVLDLDLKQRKIQTSVIFYYEVCVSFIPVLVNDSINSLCMSTLYSLDLVYCMSKRT